MIFNHDNYKYRKKWASANHNRFNGAYFYSKEICDNIIPRIQTDRNWVTVNVEGEAYDHSIIFIHNNLHPQRYDWLQKYDDLILVCGIPETCEKVAHIGTPVYLPLSVDVDYISIYKRDKDRGRAYAGRSAKRMGYSFPEGTDFLEKLPRSQLLRQMARYSEIYAVGRTAIEARVLGCDILPYDERYPDPSIWKVVDNKEAAGMLQDILDKIDGGTYEDGYNDVCR